MFSKIHLEKSDHSSAFGCDAAVWLFGEPAECELVTALWGALEHLAEEFFFQVASYECAECSIK